MSDDIVVNTDDLTANDTVVVDVPQIGGTVEITFGVGPQGLEGDRGPRGYLFTPTVSEEGVISWTNDGNLPNPEPISIKGPKGDKGDDIPDVQVATTEEVEEIITAYEEDEDMIFEMTFENLGHGEGRYTSVATTETIMAAYYAGKHVVLHFPEVSDFGVIGECWASIIGANKDDNRLYCSTVLNSEQLTEMIISGDHVLVEIFS